MDNSKAKVRLTMFYMVAILVTAIEDIAFTGITSQRTLSHALIIHLVVVLMLSAWVYCLYYYKKGYRFPFLMLVLTTFTGPFGAAICLVSSIAFACFYSKVIHPFEWISSLFACEEDDEKYRQLEHELDTTIAQTGVEPFYDILSSGTTAQKQLAITKITKYFRPQFASILIKATQDPNAAVRVQAAASIAKLERKFMSQYMKLEKSLEGIPCGDKAWLKLAIICEEYGGSWLFDKYTTNKLHNKVVKIYESYLKYHNDDNEVLMRLAAVYMKQNNHQKANGILEKIISSGDAPKNAVSMYAENLFYLNKFSRMRSVINKYNEDASKSGNNIFNGGKIGEVFKIWQHKADNVVYLKPIAEKNYGE